MGLTVYCALRIEDRKMSGIKEQQYTVIAGVDEAGRGPLAGPVIAAAVILPLAHGIVGLKDSKQLSAKQRENIFEVIQTHALAVSVGRAEVEEIDSLNIFQATLLAMQRAIQALTISPHLVLIDGTHCPSISYEARAIIKGDQTVEAISAASIVAKVTRDREMVALDITYNGYGFSVHKGYGTKSHLMALKKLGPSPIHRRSFAPVRECYE